MIFKDYYKILGLETNKVSVEEIKIAYREQAKKYHPDLNAGDNRYEERLKDINEAYKNLSDANTLMMFLMINITLIFSLNHLDKHWMNASKSIQNQ